jgi:hypothetical protein
LGTSGHVVKASHSVRRLMFYFHMTLDIGVNLTYNESLTLIIGEALRLCRFSLHFPSTTCVLDRLCSYNCCGKTA